MARNESGSGEVATDHEKKRGYAEADYELRSTILEPRMRRIGRMQSIRISGIARENYLFNSRKSWSKLFVRFVVLRFFGSLGSGKDY